MARDEDGTEEVDLNKNNPRPQVPQQAQDVSQQLKDIGSVVLSAATFNAIIKFLVSSEWRRADPILRLIDKDFQSRQAGNVMSAIRGNGEDKQDGIGPSA